MDKPDDIVGHKTFDTGERGEDGLPQFRHEPLTRAEADAMWEAAGKSKEGRAERMPDEKSAIEALFDAWLRLKELGWREAIYCPKDGSHFDVVEAGSAGIHDCSYVGKWPDGSWWLYEAGDIYPSHPVLFRPSTPADKAKP